MNRFMKNAATKIDLYFIIALAFCYAFINIMWFMKDAGVNDLMFIILLNVMFALVIISYFSSVMFCLCTCFVFILGYGSYVLYVSLFMKQSVGTMAYVWLVLIPVSCIIAVFYRTYIVEVQEQIMRLNIAAETTLGFDENTKLLNERMFYHDLNRFMSMAKRGHMSVCVMLIKLSYYRDILKLIGEDAMQELLKDLGERIGELTRNEDIQFFMDDKGIYSLILITDYQGAELVRDRIKKTVTETSLQERMKLFSLSLELKIGIAQYSDDIANALAFKNLAEKDMEYDV